MAFSAARVVGRPRSASRKRSPYLNTSYRTSSGPNSGEKKRQTDLFAVDSRAKNPYTLYAKAAAKKVASSRPFNTSKTSGGALAYAARNGSMAHKKRVHDARGRAHASSSTSATKGPETQSSSAVAKRHMETKKKQKYRIPGSNFMERMEVRLKTQQLADRHKTLQRELTRLQRNQSARQTQKDRDAARSAGKPGSHANHAVRASGVYWGKESRSAQRPVRPSSAHYSRYARSASAQKTTKQRPRSAVASNRGASAASHTPVVSAAKRLEIEINKMDSGRKSGEKETNTVLAVSSEEVVAGSGVMAVRNRIGKTPSISSAELGTASAPGSKRDAHSASTVSSRTPSVQKSSEISTRAVAAASKREEEKEEAFVVKKLRGGDEKQKEGAQVQGVLKSTSRPNRPSSAVAQRFRRPAAQRVAASKMDVGSAKPPTYTRPSTAPAKERHPPPKEKGTKTSKSGHTYTTAQYKERERLRKLVTSSTWAGRGAPDMYVIGKILGQGSFGTVRLAHHKITGHKVAIKTYEKARMSKPGQLKRCRQEIRLMEKLNHAHSIRLFETFETQKRVHLVMEACTGGNLCSYVKAKKRLSENEAVSIFHQLSMGIEYLHNNRIVHRDVKLENMLFDGSRNVKLVDYGFSVFVSDRKLRVFCGTPSYMAPEIVRRKEYWGFPVDMWSLGVLFYAMLCGRFPFTAKSYPALYKTIVRGVYKTPDYLSVNVKDLLRKMLRLDSDRRATIWQVRKHPVITERAGELSSVPPPEQCAHLVSENPLDDIDEGLMKQLVDFGFSRALLKEGVITRKKNHVTATYYLLCMKAGRRRERRNMAKLEKERKMEQISAAVNK